MYVKTSRCKRTALDEVAKTENASRNHFTVIAKCCQGIPLEKDIDAIYSWNAYSVRRKFESSIKSLEP